MKKNLLAILFLVGSMVSFAQFPWMGKVEFKTMPSKILKEDREFAIYLPRNYEKNTEKTYPVLYLLHGGGGSHKDWPGRGHLADVANQLIESNQAVEMIIVCPEAGKTFMNYFNNPDWMFEDYFFKELIPFIESTYRTKIGKENRAIAGLSMGGGGSFSYASRYPDKFCAVYTMSAYLYHQKELFWINNTGNPIQDKINRLVEENNCIRWMQQADSSAINRLKTVSWFIDCGDDDFTFTPNIELITELKKAGIPYQLLVRDGGHTWEYWHSALYIALPWISNFFR